MIIRSEEAHDAGSIRRVVRDAFAQAPHSSGNEPNIVEKLRDRSTLALSLVAVDGEQIVGHVAVSPVSIAQAAGQWVGLGPVSVLKLRQRQGIGSALITKALQHLRQSGVSGCVVLGEPEYYRRFGFEHDPTLRFRDVPAPYFQVLSFDGSRAVGPVEYDVAFEAA